uniref:Mucin 5B, oligomeric mucus/gel-forming n=1 Tax=Podarcis muralis TaxID=64176 RepID=A0A670IB07_PODMU
TGLFLLLLSMLCSGIENEEMKMLLAKSVQYTFTTFCEFAAFNSAHNGQVCSTWGQFHYKTFDGDIYYFPGTCNYVFASHCNAAYEDFNIQIRLQSLMMAICQLYTLKKSHMSLCFELHIQVIVKLGLTLLWNEKDSLMLELDKKYANQTCGLCGDFNGIPQYNEFFSNGAEITTLQFGNMQKMNGPTEECEDPTPELCQHVLTGSSFFQCNAVVGVNDYIESCVQDLCLCKQEDITSCLCDTFAEYSRQCAHAGGEPQNWRSPDLCPMECSSNMQYQECESPCTDTCSNSERSQLCEDHCVDGCFCPPGTVYDDIDNAGCIPHEQCSCVYNGKSYAPGTTYSDNCRSCSCIGGQWNCIELPCPGICSVEGGSHISTFDKKRYNVHGDCVYVLSKANDTFSVLGELRKCGLTETETCLKMVALNINGDQTVIAALNLIRMVSSLSIANVTIFRPSSFFIIVHTNVGLQLVIQLVPTMQLYIHVDPSFKGRTCGLCGNFDKRQMDDFTAISGVVEGTASAFANTWKTQAACPNIKQSFEDPCTLSIENGRSEDCMCAALSSYVRACAAEKVELPGWRTNVCCKYTTSCPKSLNYSYSISSCQPTCRSLSEPDVTCNVKFVPVDGCTCESGTYMDDYGKCVPANKCPCYYKGTSILSGLPVLWYPCLSFHLLHIFSPFALLVCVAPMVYFNCRNATAGQTGAECQKSCQTLDMHCCVSGCMCPAGLVSDGKGGCIAMEECPCIHNDATYQPGEKIKVNCNTCVCKNRMWECTKDRCLGTCAVYGDGHYITFDDKRYIFNGKCEYTLVQDHCGQNNSAPGTFRVITENVPCGTTGTTCSKSIKVFFGNYDLILSEERHELIQRGDGGQVPYKIRYMGMYLVIEANNGLILLWDKKTSVFIKLRDDFKGQVCGLCGNYDGNGMNDFTTRSQSVVSDVLEFGNSWKVSPTCPEAKCTKDPCFKNPYRKSWAQKQCSIINSKAFAACHSQVEPTRYYEACVTDSCACDTGGDCECFCTAVAAYAQACSEFGVCISWRTPSFCPMFCDYYNDERECEWHYKPCGAPCMKTCRNPSGRCHYQLPGCYPHCPADRPYFNEDEMTCVDVCGCYDDQGNYHPLGKTFDSRKTCQSWFLCCLYTPCGASTYTPITSRKPETTPATPEITTAGSRTTSKVTGGITTTLAPLVTITPGSTTTGCQPKCQWTSWFSFHTPSSDPGDGDREDIKSIQASGGTICEHPQKVECRGVDYPELSASELGQDMICDIDTGLLCENAKQRGKYKICYDYEMRALCCDYKHCETTPAPLVTTSATTTEAPGSTVGKSTAPASSTGSTPPPVVHTTTESTTLVSPTPGVTTGKPTTTETPGSTAGKSTAPAFSTGSTPPPVVFTTTESTTLVPTTPGVTTRKPTTTTHSTPLSTLPLTTPGSVSTAAVSTGVVPTVTATTLQSTPVSKPSSTIPTTGTTAQTPPGLLTTTTTLAPLVTTTPGSTTTGCQPKCQWTSWFSFHTPSSDPGDGDREDIKSIQASGGTICEHPQKVECRGVDYPELSASELGQDMICDIDTGLLCENAKQRGKYKICYDYEMRALCCDYKHCETTPAATTTEAPGSTVGKSTAPASSTGSTPPPVVHTTTESTTLVSTTPGVTTGNTAPASSTGSTPPPVVFTTTESTTLVPTTPRVTTRKPTTTTHSTPLSTLPLTTPGSVSTAAVSTGVVPTVTATTLQSTPVSKPSSTIPTTGTTAQTPPGLLTTTTTLAPLVTTTLESTSTVCLPKCNWTSWYDLHRPTSSPDDGDIENFETIRKAGGNVCKHPQDIECRAENHPDVSLYLLGQEVQCNLHVGLLCENSKQTDKMCYNFQVRYQCCEYKPCHPSTTPLSTPAASTTEKPGSTAGKSTTPASSTGSTPPPIVFTTTQSSTLVSTTPGVTIVKPTTTETPGSTAGKSTAPASSTGSTPPPIVFTTTESTTLVSATPGVTTGKPTTTETPGSTAGKSTTPASSTASTPPPIVVTTTQSTTLVSTTPGITTGKPMTTIPLSTPGSISTSSITSGVASTVSTTSLPSTHVSKPVSTISTTGITVETATVPTRVTSIPSTTGTTTVTLSRTTPCFCRVPGFSKGLFSPGEFLLMNLKSREVIYNRTDSSGCSFYAVCNRSCEIEVFQGPFTTAGTPPSPSPTTVVPSTGVYTTAAVSTPTTPVTGCPDIDPPRKTNETWMFNNCTVATCEGNNKIVLKPQPPVEKTVCVSGLPPIKIVDKDGCVERYECECICTGWDANYVTFDGTYYTFYDNCTYILVKEIVNIHGNLSVLLDNYFCDVTNNQPCSRAIIVNYNSMEVVNDAVLWKTLNPPDLYSFASFVLLFQIFFNHEPVNGDFTKYGISVTSTGTVMSVEIPALQAFISFNGLTFSVKLPFDLFQHNTEGQCGVCSNDKTDDCRLPNGHEASSCTEMASYWKTYDKNKPHCYGVPTTSPPTTTPHEPRTTTPAPTPCTTPSPLCELIVSDVFEECHKVLPPRIYYEDCLLEACQSSNDSVPCYNLEIYASLCIAKGVCTDWRNMTLGKCRKWKTTNCQECICDPLTESVQCKPQTCVSSEPPKCEKEGFVPVPVLTPKDPCCPELQCSTYLHVLFIDSQCQSIQFCPLLIKQFVLLWLLLLWLRGKHRHPDSITCWYSSEANAMQRECTCCQELKSHRRKVTLTCQDGKIIDYDYIYVDECQCMTACIPQSKI